MLLEEFEERKDLLYRSPHICINVYTIFINMFNNVINNYIMITGSFDRLSVTYFPE